MAAQRRDLSDHRDEVARLLADRGAAVVCAELGIERSKTEKGKFRCPRHGGGSLSVRVARDGRFQVRCFGCDLAGDVFVLLAEAMGLDAHTDFRRVLIESARVAHAWNVVEELEGTPAHARPVASPPKMPPPKAEELAPLDGDTFDHVATFLLERCPLDDDASAYLEARRMRDLAAEAGWGALPGSTKAQDELLAELDATFGEDTLRRSGLLAREGRTRFVWSDHRLLIPWRAPGVFGGVHTLQRRLLRAPRSPNEPKYVFPSGMGRPAWPYLVVADLEELGERTAVAFVEGAPDVLALRWLARSEGLDVLVLGLPGIENWRPEWASFAEGRGVLLALDGDKAGEGKIKAMHADMHAATSWKRWRAKGGKDWGEIVAKVRT